ncbi:MAG: aldose 1-epimerase family protein [Pirellulales bacterium]|nr:aldose 1-epimerase family protein [Pirellulales bacterium]
MPAPTWLLSDTRADLDCGDLSLGTADFMGAQRPLSVRRRYLRGGLRDGVEVIEVETERFDFTIVPTRGMGLWKAGHTAASRDARFVLGWQAPVQGPVHPRNVNLWEPGGLGWLSGFDELLCRCGLESNGGPDYDANGRLCYPLHGKIANTPAWQTRVSFDAERQELRVEGTCDETRLFHSKLRLETSYRVRLGESRLTIHDVVTNLSAEPAGLQLLYHTNFGPPLLERGARVVLPAKSVIPQTPRAAEGVETWDVYGPPEAGFTEQVYFFELAAGADGRAETMLVNAAGDRAATLRFRADQLPCFTLWKSTQAETDGYVTGLEPSINLPNVRSFEERQGRVTPLEGGESRTFELELGLTTDAAEIAATAQRIASAAGGAPKIYTQPQPGWSAG